MDKLHTAIEIVESTGGVVSSQVCSSTRNSVVGAGTVAHRLVFCNKLAEERSAAKATSEMFFWFGTLTVVSTILTVTNKYLMKQYPFPNMILLLQSAMSALLLCGASLFRMTDIKPISLGQISIFLVSSLFKVAQVITALKALPLVAIATTMVFRNFAIVATAICDCMFFSWQPTRQTVLALFVVLFGSLMYTGADINFNPQGYMWLTVNAFLYVASVLYNKVFQTRLQKGNEQTATGNAMIEQTWMCLWGVGFAYGAGEIQQGAIGEVWKLSPTVLAWFVATGVAAPVIGTAYARCFAISNPTTVTVAATVNKCVAIVIAAFVFSTVLTSVQYMGLLITIGGGAWFAEVKKKKG